jgi:hypothetical protein
MKKNYGIEIGQNKKIVDIKSLKSDRTLKEFESFNKFCLCSQKKVEENWTLNFDFITTTLFYVPPPLLFALTYEL